MNIVVAFIVWRVALFATAAISPTFIKDFGAKFPYWEERLVASNLPQFIWSFGNFDGVHYLGIARDAYAYQFTQAFFPFYPIIIKVFSLAIPNLLLSALLVSNIAFLLSILLFYKLVKKNFSEETARWSVLFLLAFPTSFYFGSVYTEGFFFLTIVSYFYLLEKQKPMLAGIVGIFASATRLIGVFLATAILFSKIPKKIIPIILTPIGFIIYVIYLKVEFNNPLYFLTSQQIFGQERSTTSVVLLPQVFYRYLKILSTTEGKVLFTASIELASTALALVLLFYSYKKVKKEWFLFSLAAISLPTLTGTLASMPRYILVAFPIYIVLAQVKNKWVKSSILVVFIAFSLILVTLFTRGYWVA